MNENVVNVHFVRPPVGAPIGSMGRRRQSASINPVRTEVVQPKG